MPKDILQYKKEVKIIMQ